MKKQTEYKTAFYSFAAMAVMILILVIDNLLN